MCVCVQVAAFASATDAAAGARASLVVLGDPQPSTVNVVKNASHVIATTPRLQVTGDMATGAITATDLATHVALQLGAPVFTRNTDNASLYTVRTPVSSNQAQERLFGFGQLQNKFLDYNQASLQLIQFNTEAIGE